MIKSLRWRLQIWHAWILLAVIAGFGVVLYLQSRRARFEEIDGELAAAAGMLEGVLRSVPPPPPGHGPGPPPGLSSGHDHPPHARPPLPGSDNPPPGLPFGRPPPPRPLDHIEHSLTLPMSLVDRYADCETPPYFVIWRPGGEVLRAVGAGMDFSEPRHPEGGPPWPGPGKGPRPHRGGLPPPQPSGDEPSVNQVESRPVPPHLRDDRSIGENDGRVPSILPPRPVSSNPRLRRTLREVVLDGPDGTRILVGRSIERELRGLHGLALQLSLTGAGVFAIGLAGGWWLSRRVVKPIETMGETASAISASNLSRRIDVAEVDDELGKLAGILNAMFDRLEGAFQRQTRFTADASHELRTPLAVILSNVELALSRERTAEDYRETLETCHRAAQRMKSLTDDLLTLARADSGRLELRSEPVDVRKVVQECVEFLEPLAREQEVLLRVTGESAIVTGDQDRLTQVATNLLTNAIQYNRRQGEVVASLQTNGSEVVLSVADTGAGIAPEALPHLFDRFFRVDQARSRASGGSGLGLAICRSIVEAHGGSIAVASQQGVGTTFTVHLPALSGPR